MRRRRRARGRRNLVLNIYISSFFQKIKNKRNAADGARAVKCSISRLNMNEGERREGKADLIPHINIGALLEEQRYHGQIFLVAIKVQR
jgi:hypothetical protein